MWDLWWTKWHGGRFFFPVLRFPLSILIPLNAEHSSTIRGWYNGPISDRRTNWSQSHPTLGMKQEVLGRTILLLSLIRHGPHWKRRVQQFFSCCGCIRHGGNVSTGSLPSNDRGIFTEPLPSNDRGIFTEPLPSNDKGTFTEPLPSNDRGIHRHTDSNVIS
jgi:hypothetical protein